MAGRAYPGRAVAVPCRAGRAGLGSMALGPLVRSGPGSSIPRVISLNACRAQPGHVRLGHAHLWGASWSPVPDTDSLSGGMGVLIGFSRVPARWVRVGHPTPGFFSFQDLAAFDSSP